MSTRPEPAAVARSPLTKERVVIAALAMADEHGIEAVSMRKLARALGFEAMSLYNHVANKDEIVAAALDLVAAEIAPPSTDPDWKTAIRVSAVSARQVLLRHPWAGALWLNAWPGPARIRHMESILGCLREAGFSIELTHHGFHALNNHILGYTLQELSANFQEGEFEEVAEGFFASTASERFPYMTEHAIHHLEGLDEGSDFEFVLDLIVDGLELVRDR